MDSYDQLEKRKFGIGFAVLMFLAAIGAWIIWMIPDRWWKNRHEIGVAIVALATLIILAYITYPHCGVWCSR